MFKGMQDKLDLDKYHFNKQQQKRPDDTQPACLPFGPA